MGGPSGGTSGSSQAAGSLSPVTASLWQMFSERPAVGTFGGMYQPTSFGGGLFSPASFSALPGLLQNQPMSGAEGLVTGAGPGGRFGESPSFADLAAQSALLGQNTLAAGVPGIVAAMNPDPSAQITLARWGFENETLPQLKESMSPAAWASSDFSGQLTRAGTELETNIAALREGALDRVISAAGAVPNYVSALGSNLLESGANVMNYGNVGREFLRGVSPAGDALRVLETLQALTGPALANIGRSSGKQWGSF